LKEIDKRRRRGLTVESNSKSFIKFCAIRTFEGRNLTNPVSQGHEHHSKKPYLSQRVMLINVLLGYIGWIRIDIFNVETIDLGNGLENSAPWIPLQDQMERSEAFFK
jgi:hypothetical protein